MRLISTAVFVSVIFAVLLLGGCTTSYETILIPKEYDFSGNRTVGVYVVPSAFPARDETYANLMSLDLMSRGYHTLVMNRLLQAHGDSLPARNPDSTAVRWLLARPYMPKLEVVATVRPQWDSTVIITYYSEHHTLRTVEMLFGGVRLPRLRSEFMMFDVASGRTLLRRLFTDTCQLYSVNGTTDPSFAEYPWVAEARQVTGAFRGIPVCSIADSVLPAATIPVMFYVDRNYREKFPTQWQERLTRRLLFASDILEKQFGMALEPGGFREWNSRYESSLDYTLNKLRGATSERAKVLQIGGTVDGSLTRYWRKRSHIGVAFPLGIDAVITAQPSFPDVSEWNSIEEALTLVHEIAHLFGAAHSQEEASVMYPDAGPLSYRFDSLNARIINGMKSRFLELDEEERCRQYLRVLSGATSAHMQNSVAVLDPAARAVARLFGLATAEFLVRRDSVDLTALMNGLIADSSFRSALRGYIEYKAGDLEEAEKDLRKAIAARPDFAEAHIYLSRVFAGKKMTREADDERRIAGKYGMWRIIDE